MITRREAMRMGAAGAAISMFGLGDGRTAHAEDALLSLDAISPAALNSTGIKVLANASRIAVPSYRFGVVMRSGVAASGGQGSRRAFIWFRCSPNYLRITPRLRWPVLRSRSFSRREWRSGRRVNLCTLRATTTGPRLTGGIRLAVGMPMHRPCPSRARRMTILPTSIALIPACSLRPARTAQAL